MTSSASERLAVSGRHYLNTLRRAWWVIAVCAVSAGGAAYAISSSQDPRYESTASVLFRAGNIDQQLFGFSSNLRSLDAGRDAATNLELVLQPSVGEAVADILDVAPSSIGQTVRAEQSGSSDIVNITASDRSPREAARLATLYAETFIEERRQSDTERILAARKRVDQQLKTIPKTDDASENRAVLLARARQLDTMAAVQTGNAELVARGRTPSSPVSPRVARSTVLGAILGGLVGVGLLLVRARFEQRVLDSDDVPAIYGMPVLGEVPESKELADRTSNRKLPEAQADAFRLLRARLQYFNIDRQVGSVLVTSAAPGEGKSTVAWHLAAAAAEIRPDSSVLLIEADLRRPALSNVRQLRRVPGLSDVLASNRPLEDAIQAVSLEPAHTGGATFSFLSAGSEVPSPTEVLSSRKFEATLRDLSAQYDFIVVDAAPASMVPDTLPLLKQVDGVLAVARIGYSQRRAGRQLLAQLLDAEATVLGAVVNGVRRPSLPYYGYYDSETRANGSVDAPVPTV